MCPWLLVMACAAATAMAQAPQPDSEPPPPASQSDAAEASRDDPPPEKAEVPVDFPSDIQPILTMHCLKCHGAERHSSGLRLDTREFAQRGGDSGKPVMGATPTTNELLTRVSSSERTYRMPKNAPPLAQHEIDLLRRWVEQGTPWPEPLDVKSSKPSYERWLIQAGDWADRYEPEYSYAMPYSIGFLVLQLMLLIVLRCRTACHQGRPWTTGRLARFCKFCDGVKTREVLFVMLLSLGGLAFAVMRGHVLKFERQLAKAEMASRNLVRSPWFNTVYGWPPRPLRPEHPKQVAGTYYRGNCERNPDLFNGGNYLTAIFRVSLCGREHQQLDVDQPLPDGGVFVRLDIERAPGTTDLLFSKELMDSVVLVRNFYEIPDNRLKEKPVRLETLEPDKRWVAYFPLEIPPDAVNLIGEIYVYTGQVHEDMLAGTLHYGIGYELRFSDGKLSPESDLWMNSFGNGAFNDPTPPGKRPYREWFDYRPMPIMTGENSKDPKLLGVEQYIKEGLIHPDRNEKPAQKKPVDEAPKPASADQTGEPPDAE